jgi:hypothetical protein
LSPKAAARSKKPTLLIRSKPANAVLPAPKTKAASKLPISASAKQTRCQLQAGTSNRWRAIEAPR